MRQFIEYFVYMRDVSSKTDRSVLCNGNQATVCCTKGGHVTNSGCHLDRHWYRQRHRERERVQTLLGAAGSLVSLLLEIN